MAFIFETINFMNSILSVNVKSVCQDYAYLMSKQALINDMNTDFHLFLAMNFLNAQEK